MSAASCNASDLHWNELYARNRAGEVGPLYCLKKACSREHFDRLQIALVACRGLSFERLFTHAFQERCADILKPIFKMIRPASRPLRLCDIRHPLFFLFLFLLSFSLLFGWQLSIWICCNPLFSLLYNCRL
jgi:hypothetical protein